MTGRFQAYLLAGLLAFVYIVGMVAETVAPGRGVFGP